VSADNRIKKVLTIAGSDPSGGAGIQADLKTFSQLRVYGMAVVAAMTVQNTLGVSAVAEVAADFVADQLAAVLNDIPPDATKTGMLLTAGVIEAVAKKVTEFGIPNLVVDPVMMSTSGAQLLNEDAIAVFRRTLLPLAFLVTPNIHEASTLSTIHIRTLSDMEEAARKIREMGVRNVLIKGGHLAGDDATDILFDGKELSLFRSQRLPMQSPHGTGCVLSAAITAHLAFGKPLKDAVAMGKEFVTNAIRNSLRIGKGTASCDPLLLGG
jgi:hydroxymethylpyrimidine/phosphomethylpyrimidine kinase